MAVVEKSVTGYVCDKCGHDWIPKKETVGLPKICPECKTHLWNVGKDKVKPPMSAKK